jgi:hypothetical protein
VIDSVADLVTAAIQSLGMHVTLNHFFGDDCRALRDNPGQHLLWLDSLQTDQNVTRQERLIYGSAAKTSLVQAPKSKESI